MIRFIPTRERTLVDRFRDGGVRDPEALVDQIERSLAEMIRGTPGVSLDELDRMIRDAS
jgi:hypothetical protein